MDIDTAFGVVLKRLRTDKGLSQEALADISGFHRTYVSLLERGLKTPSLTTLQRISQSLEMPMFQLVQLIEQEAAKANSASRRETR